MERFSERLGFKRKKGLQIECMDDDLRNRLWNVVRLHLHDIDRHYPLGSDFYLFVRCDLWERYFKKQTEDIPDEFDGQLRQLRIWFNDCLWHEVYDLIEFIHQDYPSIGATSNSFMATGPIRFKIEIDRVLKEESSGYRFIGNVISQTHAKVEEEEIEDALDSPIPVKNHFQRSLELLSDKTQPDYTNSIKESISAVESMANLVTGVKNPSLGQALPKIERKLGHELHGAKRKAILSLYGWASDEARHGLLEVSHLTQEDARFALIVCSAFVNYLKAKAANAGISLGPNA